MAIQGSIILEGYFGMVVQRWIVVQFYYALDEFDRILYPQSNLFQQGLIVFAIRFYALLTLLVSEWKPPYLEKPLIDGHNLAVVADNENTIW